MYEQIAGRLLDDDEADIDVVTVDATLDTDLAKEVFGVSQYPTIVLLKGAQDHRAQAAACNRLLLPALSGRSP